MKRTLAVILCFSLLFLLTACLKKSDSPCSICESEDAYLYKITHVGKKVLDEHIEVSYCEDCYTIYLEKTFGNGVRAKAEKEDEHFKNVIGAGGYLEELKE